MNRPSLPERPVRVRVRFVANQPAGAPSWRAIVEPPGALPAEGLVVHAVTFLASSWTVREEPRSHVVSVGHLAWDPCPEELRLRVLP